MPARQVSNRRRGLAMAEYGFWVSRRELSCASFFQNSTYYPIKRRFKLLRVPHALDSLRRPTDDTTVSLSFRRPQQGVQRQARPLPDHSRTIIPLPERFFWRPAATSFARLRAQSGRAARYNLHRLPQSEAQALLVLNQEFRFSRCACRSSGRRLAGRFFYVTAAMCTAGSSRISLRAMLPPRQLSKLRPRWIRRIQLVR